MNKYLLRMLIIFCVLSGHAFASEVFFDDLENVVKKAKTIFVAEIQESEITRTYVKNTSLTKDVTITFVITAKEKILGNMPSLNIKCYYSEEVPYLFDKNGNIIGGYSPMRSGSGNEFNYKKGDIVIIFFADPVLGTAENTEVLRIEKLDNKKLILESLVSKTNTHNNSIQRTLKRR